MKLKVFAATCILALSLPVTSHAAIAVIDSQNIAQQLKTYVEAELIKKFNEAQLALMQRENEPLSNDYGIPDDIISSSNTVTTILRSVSSIFSGGNVAPYWANRFPRITVPSDPTEWYKTVRDSEVAAANLREKQSQDNQKTIEAIQSLMKELEEEQQRLQKLQQIEVVGNMQAQEVERIIAVSRGNIARIHAAIDALNTKHQIETNEMKINMEQNHDMAMEIAGEGEIKAIEKMRQESSGLQPALVDPIGDYYRQNGVSSLW
ncbi:MAG: hypothetical protein IJ601_10660 [Acidaminococcaceae bacterium]|nr:hypothetical protein [Acidaminococcaceae bacterium]